MAIYRRKSPLLNADIWKSYVTRRDSDAITRITHPLLPGSVLGSLERDTYVAGLVGLMIAEAGADVERVLEDVRQRAQDHARRNRDA